MFTAVLQKNSTTTQYIHVSTSNGREMGLFLRPFSEELSYPRSAVRLGAGPPPLPAASLEQPEQKERDLHC